MKQFKKDANKLIEEACEQGWENVSGIQERMEKLIDEHEKKIKEKLAADDEEEK